MLKIKKFTLIDKNLKLFGKIDIFVPLFIVIIVVLVGFIGRVLYQKDTYVNVELFASGGEWWWNNPEPPYWLVDPVRPGAVEYDPVGGKLVEVLDTQKFEVGDRKMLWVKARLKVSKSGRSQQYRFRREPLQVGSVIYVAPNNVKIYSSVMWIEGVDEVRQDSERTIALRAYDMYPWHADAIAVGSAMKDDKGKILAEVVDKQEVFSEAVTHDDLGNIHVTQNPTRRDVTIKVRMKTIRTKDRDYFSYFQPLKIGFNLWIPFENTNFYGSIVTIE